MVDVYDLLTLKTDASDVRPGMILYVQKLQNRPDLGCNIWLVLDKLPKEIPPDWEFFLMQDLLVEKPHFEFAWRRSLVP
mgnify:CR=1 FL=1